MSALIQKAASDLAVFVKEDGAGNKTSADQILINDGR
jgi:hypothetical protein